jgi:transposase
VIDRIRANAYREVMEEGAAFINRKWIAQKLHRTDRWVTDNWKKGYEYCFTEFGNGRPDKLSEEGKNIVMESSGKRQRSCKRVAKEIFERCGEVVSRSTIQRYRVKQGLKAFHVISKPMKSATNIEDRLCFCDYFRHWSESDFMHLAPSDEFFVWTVRRPNYQNDRIWSLSSEDIPDNERYQELPTKPSCIGIFICFTAVKLIWVIKDDGASWDGAYYRQSILVENVIPFLTDSRNVLEPWEVVYLHDSAPCHKANATQALLKDCEIDFFDRTQWPGNSPDLNVAEDFGSILMDKVESLMINESGVNQHSKVVLLRHLQHVLHELENETELFENLLKSYPQRLEAVREANGGHTKY